MKQDRTVIRWLMLIFLLVGSLLAWYAGSRASRVIKQTFAPYNQVLRQQKQTPLSLIDTMNAHKVNGQLYPKMILIKTGQPCGSNCLAQLAVEQQRAGPLKLTDVMQASGALLFFGALFAVALFASNPRRNLINLGRERIRINTPLDSLPVIQQGANQWGIMARPNLKGSGRREPGNGLFIGGPGSGKSSIIKYWLLTCDLLNFFVIDPKGELWQQTAGYRAKLGRVIRIDLTSLTGDSYDPLDTDNKDKVLERLAIIIPNSDNETSNHFARAARSLTTAFWSVARAINKPAMPIIAEAASAGNIQEIIDFANTLIALAPREKQRALIRNFQSALAEVWEEPKDASNEKKSTVSTFQGAFSGMNSPTILSSMIGRTFKAEDLIRKRTTFYITAQAANEGSTHKLPLELIAGAIMDEVMDTADKKGRGNELVMIADEAGIVKIPLLESIAASGRSRGITLTAFCQGLGQLRLYHRDGWRGISSNFHHWIQWPTRTEDEVNFLRDNCKKYDRPSNSRDADERKRRPYEEVWAFDDMEGWPESEVMALFRYKRDFVVKGEFVTPYSNKKLMAKMKLAAPKWAAQRVPERFMTDPEAPPLVTLPSTEPPAAPQAPTRPASVLPPEQFDETTETPENPRQEQAQQPQQASTHLVGDSDPLFTVLDDMDETF